MSSFLLQLIKKLATAIVYLHSVITVYSVHGEINLTMMMIDKIS